MTRSPHFLPLLALLGLTMAAPALASDAAGDVSQWTFNVFLNDKKVGKHSFTVSENDGEKQVESEASFKYTVLWIPAYRYQHRAEERWDDECLVELEARTNANGERIEVKGEQTGSAFRLANGDHQADLPECVMTFAYWNPRFLGQSRLLNPQTGEFVDVTIDQVGTDMLDVRGEPVAATRFRLTADEIDITLWYSPSDEWLALESVAKGGHIIRYELS